MAVKFDRVASSADSHGERSPFVAVVERELEVRERIERALARDDVSSFASLNDLVSAGLQRISTVIIILGPSLSDRRSIDQLGVLSRIRSGVGGILIVDSMSPEVMRLALRAGLADAVGLEEIEGELQSVVEALAARLVKDVTGAGESQAFRPIEGPERGRVTVVFSPKGGVGKSAISVNLATAMARRTQRTTILVDLDLQFGDLAVMLRLQPAHSVGEIGGSAEFDADFIRGLLVQHEPSGVWLLAAPTEPSAAEAITARSISRLVATLRELAPQVIIDTPPILSEVILQLLDDADEIAFLVGMDVPSVKNARVALHALRVVGIPSERIVLVLNRADSKVNLALKDVERALGRKIDVKIPSDVIVTQSINKGIPAILEYERSQFARSIDGMVTTVRERAERGAGT